MKFLSRLALSTALLMNITALSTVAHASSSGLAKLIFLDRSSSEFPVTASYKVFDANGSAIGISKLEAVSKAVNNNKYLGKYPDDRSLPKEASKVFGKAEIFSLKLPTNSDGSLLLKIVDNGNVASWNIPTSGKSAPYFSIFVTNYYTSVAYLINDRTWKVLKPKNISPSLTNDYKDELSKNLSLIPENHMERPNPWISLRLHYSAFNHASDQADIETCKAFGPDCNGSGSFADINSSYTTAKNQFIDPAVRELFFANSIGGGSPDAKVATALLKLEQAAQKTADCYQQVITATSNADQNAYDAVSNCFSDATQLFSLLNIDVRPYNFVAKTIFEVGEYPGIHHLNS